MSVAEDIAPVAANPPAADRTPKRPPTRFYAKREPVYQQKTEGPFRRFKWLVMLATIAIYYITPWIR